MRLREAILIYTQARQAEGSSWAKGTQNLRSFYSHVGDMALADIRITDVEEFLNGPMTSPMTWYKKYSVLRGFFRYWRARDAIGRLPLPPSRRSPVQTFVPYIYSRKEIQRLLTASGIVQRQFKCVIEPRTFRTLLLFLYGTGAMIGEAVGLKQCDIDLRRKQIRIQSSQINRSRVIPIGSDLADILREYDQLHHQQCKSPELPFFLTRDGAPIKTDTANQTFQRVREQAGIMRNDGSRYQPRMHDLRHTFAVHRLTAWFKHSADMNQMIPALSAYMGQHDLGATDRYLLLTPERFRSQLNKLSPKRGKKRWRDDAALMKFLDGL